MHEVYFHGALRILVDTATGRVLAVQDRISGVAASLRYAPDYIARAEQAAILAYESQFSEA